MKKTFKLLLFILICMLFSSSVCMASSEISATSTENQIEATYEYIASDVYEFQDEVVIDSIIDGNAFAFGNNVTVTGEIGGDVFAFGSNVTIADNAYIHGSIFVCAENFVSNGICYDIYATADSFTLGENAIVARDIRVASNSIHIDGQIKRDAYITTNELIFANNSSNLITGNLEYSSSYEFDIPEGIVGGEILFTLEGYEEVSVSDTIIDYITDIVSTLIYSFAVVLLAIWLTPKFAEKSSTLLKKKCALSFGVGILASLAIIAGAFILLIFTAGFCFEVSIALIAIFVLALTISKTVFSIACAKLICSKFQNCKNVLFVIITLLVVLTVSLIELIPYIGDIVGLAICMIGFGIIVLNLIIKKDSKPVTSTNVEEN